MEPKKALQIVPEFTPIYWRDVKKTSTCFVNGVLKYKELAVALYVAPLTPSDDPPPIDPRGSRFQVRAAALHDTGETVDLRVTEFTDKELAVAYCERAAFLRENPRIRDGR